jgi:hypothetical protein
MAFQVQQSPNDPMMNHLIAMVQFHSTLRETAVKNGVGQHLLTSGSSWSLENTISGKGRHRNGSNTNFLETFRSNGIPTPVLDISSLAGSTRLQGPWLKAANGVIEMIEVLETAGVEADVSTLKPKEAKLLVCKAMIEVLCVAPQLLLVDDTCFVAGVL